MDDWRPATIDKVNEIVEMHLKACDAATELASASSLRKSWILRARGVM
jgi:hypothetical protein